MPRRKASKKKKPNTGDKIIDNLYQAVIDYIESRGGKVVVIGGTAIVNEGQKFSYGLMVRITGNPPLWDSKKETE